MVAYKELNGKLTKRGHIGHIPEVPVGFEVNGKGELAILGIHCDINKGIYSKYGSLFFIYECQYSSHEILS